MASSRLSQCYRQPKIYKNQNIASFLLHVVDKHQPPTSLIVCTEQQTFLEQLLASLNENVSVQENIMSRSCLKNPIQLLSRTISYLTAAQTVNLIFCTSVPSLHAYLSSLSTLFISSSDMQVKDDGGTPMLCLINPVALHRETASYSAQGLSKTFASAVDAAWRSGQELIVVEIANHISNQSDEQAEALPRDDTHRADDADNDARMTDEAEGSQNDVTIEDLWDEHIPILNSTTKTSGTAGDRSWLGRTVSIKDVAKRWFVFETIPP